MPQEIMHVGIPATNRDRFPAFYQKVPGLRFQGELLMEGREADPLFGRENCRAQAACPDGGDHVMAPPVELIQFHGGGASESPGGLFRTPISEICFRVDDLDRAYEHLKAHGVT